MELLIIVVYLLNKQRTMYNQQTLTQLEAEFEKALASGKNVSKAAKAVSDYRVAFNAQEEPKIEAARKAAFNERITNLVADVQFYSWIDKNF